MNYTINIPKWVRQYLPAMLRKPIRIGITIALVSVLNWFYNEFQQFRMFVYVRVGYNSQQRSLEYLLNKVFNTGTLIKVRTVSDSIPAYYAFNETVPVGYERVYADATPMIYASSGEPRLQGEVIAPASLMGRDGEIKAWVNYVAFADKNYKVIYI